MAYCNCAYTPPECRPCMNCRRRGVVPATHMIVWTGGYDVFLEEFATEELARERYAEIQTFPKFGRVKLLRILDDKTEESVRVRDSVDQ